jgi:hypothetical protein
MKVTYLRKINYQDPTLRGASVASTAEVLASAMLLLLIVGN